MPETRCHINAGMERIFFSKINDSPCDLSKSSKYSVFFDIEFPNTPYEKRFLRVVERNGGMQKFKVLLNENAGAKPLNGNTSQHEPLRRSNPHLDFPIDTDKGRIFFAEKNLSDDPNIMIFLRIFPRTNQDDKKRYLTFIQTGLIAGTTDLEDINLTDFGGKKPLGGSGGSLTTRNKLSKQKMR